MLNQETRTIRCPKCGETLDVNAVLARQVEETLRVVLPHSAAEVNRYANILIRPQT